MIGLPCRVCYRVEPDTKLALVIPGRRIPEKMTLWLSFEGVMSLMMPLLNGAVHMPKTTDAVWGIEFDVLKMRRGDEPQMYSAEEMAAAQAEGEKQAESAPEGPKIDA